MEEILTYRDATLNLIEKHASLDDSPFSIPLKGIENKKVQAFIHFAQLDSREEIDERHYFSVPFPMNDSGYAILLFRYISKGYSCVNTLPKINYIHAPNNSNMVELARMLPSEMGTPGVCNTPNDYCRHIDDAELRWGAAKSWLGNISLNQYSDTTLHNLSTQLPVTPGTIACNFGFKNLGAKLNKAQLGKELRRIQKDMMHSFHRAPCKVIVNPLLNILEQAVTQSDKNIDSFSDQYYNYLDFPVFDRERFVALSQFALKAFYNRDGAIPPGYFNKKDTAWIQKICAALTEFNF